MQCDIGVVGLGVMGSNLALNMERQGFRVAGYDLDSAKARAFIGGPAAGKNVVPADSPEALMSALKKQRRMLMMVPAGAPVDSAIVLLKRHLEPGDILIDGGNSFFLDTERRNKRSRPKASISSAWACRAARGAFWGPSLMPGGSREAWERPPPILRAIAAKAEDGEPCVEYMGRAARATTSRWCITASSTAICS